MEIVHQGPGGIARIGDVFPGHPPTKPGIDRSEGELARFGALSGAVHMIEHPARLGAGEVRIEHQACCVFEQRFVARFAQRCAGIGGAAVLPDQRSVYGPT